jgi:hypothetical protein
MPDSLTWGVCIRFDVDFDLDIGTTLVMPRMVSETSIIHAPPERRSGNLVEPATHDSDYMMPSAEVHKTMDRVDPIGPESRERRVGNVSGLNQVVCRDDVGQRGREEDQKW